MPDAGAEKGLDLEVLYFGIERRAPDLLIDFYTVDAQLSIVNASAPQGLPFELRGKAEIAKHLRAAFSQGTAHRVEREGVVSREDGVRFREVCEYPDGSRLAIETTLEVRDGRIVRQVDVVAQYTRADSEEEIGQSLPDRKTQPRTRPGADATPNDRLPHFEQATEKEDFG